MNIPVGEGRRAHRAPCALPVRLTSLGRTIDAEVRDLCRQGARVHIGAEALDLPGASDLERIGERLAERLTDVVVADFNHDALGTLVRRGLKLVRLSLPRSDEDGVDLGCALRTPLTDEELAVLGLGAWAGADPATHRPSSEMRGAGWGASAFEEARQRGALSSAYLSAQRGRAGVPIRAADFAFVEAMFLVRLPLVPVEGDAEAGRLALGAFRDFLRSYGDPLSLLVIRHRDPVWSGPVRIHSVEAGLDRDLLLGVSAVRPLESDIALRLGEPNPPEAP